MSEDIVNGHPSLTQAAKASRLPGYDAALMEMQRKLGLAGCVGTVTFVLYADGSFVATPVGKVTPGLVHVIGRWGLDSLMQTCGELKQESLQRNLAAASPLRRN